MFGFAAAAVCAGAVFRAHADRPGTLFSASWLSVFGAGVVLVFSPHGLTEPGLAFLGTLFASLQLAGAIALVWGRAPVAAIVLPLAIALVRVAAALAGFTREQVWIALTLEPAALLAAAGLLAGYARRGGAGRGAGVAAAIVAAAAVSNAASAWTHAFDSEVPALLWVFWLAASAVALPIQLQLASSREVRDEVRLRRVIESELHESRERYRALTESAFDLVAELDPDERFTYVNPKYEEVLGHPPSAMLGARAVDFIHPDDRPAAARFADEATRAARASGLVVRVRHRDGRTVWLESAASAFTTPAGERRWVLNSRDVTHRQLREAQREQARMRLEATVSERTGALQTSEARFRALADHAPELISEFDERGRYIFANRSFHDLLGYEPESLLGTRPERLIHPDDLAASRVGMSRAMLEVGASHALHRLRHADGSWRWFDNTGRAYRTERGALRFVSIGRDVTEARRAEAERLELESHMQEVQRLESLGVLAGGIAHDFNNLLAVILGNVSLLESGQASDAEHKQRLRRIRAAARHAEALTDQMLAYAGRSLSELVSLDLADLVRDTEDLLQACVSKTCRLELALEDGLFVKGDPTRLRQVLMNLVRNASEAIGDRPGRIAVRVIGAVASAEDLAGGFGTEAPAPGPTVLLEISDDGPGMDEELRRRIFEPFFTTKARGRGLGLAAVLGIASAHRGLLKVEAAPGCGTRFRLWLAPSAPLPEPAAARRPAPRPAPRALSGRVLVIDDDDAVREVAARLLERAGFRVETAADAGEALARLRSGGVDAVLLDLVMPGLSGGDALRALRAERPDLPIVLASGLRGELGAEGIGAEAVSGFVEKPYEPERLAAAVRDAIRSAAADPAPAAYSSPLRAPTSTDAT